MSSLRVITPEEWHEMSRDTDMMLIDLRSQKDYRKYHIEGASNIPYEQIRKIAPFRKKELLLYCDQGITSTAAGLMLAQRGLLCGVQFLAILILHNELYLRPFCLLYQSFQCFMIQFNGCLGKLDGGCIDAVVLLCSCICQYLHRFLT